MGKSTPVLGYRLKPCPNKKQFYYTFFYDPPLHIYRKTNKQTDTLTERQTENKTDKWIDRQTDRQTYGQMEG